VIPVPENSNMTSCRHQVITASVRRVHNNFRGGNPFASNFPFFFQAAIHHVHRQAEDHISFCYQQYFGHNDNASIH
jgi:hypothetical protein